VELDTNFGTIFSVWDRWGGTYRAIDPTRSQRTGLPDSSRSNPSSPTGWLLFPFTGASSRRLDQGA